MLVYVGWFILHLVDVSFKNFFSDTPSSVITKSISPVEQSHGLLFFSTHHWCSSTLSDAGHCNSPLHQVFVLTLLMIVSHHKYILKYPDLVSSILLSTTCLTTLIVYCLVLLLILIILAKFCVCFMLVWSVDSLVAFCLLMLVLVCFYESQLVMMKQTPFL